MEVDEGDLSDYDIHLIMEALSSRQSKNVASCALSIKILLYEIQKQLLILMGNDNSRVNDAGGSESESMAEDDDDDDEDYVYKEYYNKKADPIVSDGEEEIKEPMKEQQSVVTGATVPITGSLQKPPESFPCAECGEVFTTKKALSQHRTLQHRSADDSSASNTENPSEIEGQEAETNGESVEVKQEAGAEMGKESLMDKLELRKKRNKLIPSSVPGKVKCEHCGKETLKQHMARHMLIHSGVKEFKCNLCDAAYYRKDKLKEHMKKHEGGYVAPVAPGASAEKEKKESKPNKPVKCRRCGFTSSDKKEMKEHRLTHPADMMHSCEHCDKKFSCMSHLAQHAIKHMTEKPYICDICGVPFSREPNLLRHMKSHTDPAPFNCKFCNKPYHRKNELVVHERNHTGEKPYICEICGNAYASNKYLKRHLFTHTGLKPYKCDLCERAFARPENMRAHRKLHDKGATRRVNSGMMPTITPHQAASDPITAAMMSGMNRSDSLDESAQLHSPTDSHDDMSYELPTTSGIGRVGSVSHDEPGDSPRRELWFPSQPFNADTS